MIVVGALARRGRPLVGIVAWGVLSALAACQHVSREADATPPAATARASELVTGGQAQLHPTQADLRGDPLLAPGARWRYLDDGSDPGPRFAARDFDDRAWKSGPAPLGFGLGSEATVVGFGPDPTHKYATTYFRNEFRVTSLTAIDRVVLRLQHDDGAAVYLNGMEIYRENLPAGALSRTTFSVAPRPPAVVERVLDPVLVRAALRTGRNVVAAEVHQSDPASPELRFDLAIIANPNVTVTRGPYLQIGAPTEATIRWRTDLPARSRVTYGALGAGGPMRTADSTGDPTTEHLVRITGLSPNTRYDYTIGTPGAVLAGGDGEHFLVTAPPPGMVKPIRIWAVGDSGTADNNARDVYRAYRDYTGLRHTDVWLMLGDNAYLIGTDEDFQRAVFDFYPETLRQVFLWPVIGNHETYFGGAADQAPYLDIFSMPTRGEAGGLASGSKLYYSFDHGNIHFVALDSMVSSRAPGAPMWTWLEADLAATDRTWLIAFWHHPPYSKGSHDSDNGTGLDPELVEMREQALPILETHGVDLVLNGHSHSYERSYMLHGHYGDSTTLAPQMKLDNGDGQRDGTGAYAKNARARGSKDGAVYVVAGSAGQVTAPLVPGPHPAMLVSLLQLGSLVIDVEGDHLRAVFLRETGEIADQFAMDKNVPPATVAPQAPTDLQAFASPGGGAALFWSHQGTDETGFRIERATADGAFAAVTDLGANASDYADLGAPADVPLHYRVRATNAAGASPPSNVATLNAVDRPALPGTPAPLGPGIPVRTAGGGGLGCAVGVSSAGFGSVWWSLSAVALALRWARARRRWDRRARRSRPALARRSALAGCARAAPWLLPLMVVVASPAARAHGTAAERLSAAAAEIDANPDRGLPYLRRGELLLELGRREDALADAERAVQVEPGIPGADRLAARVLLDQGRTDEARARLDRAVAAAPEDAAAWEARADLFERGAQPARAAQDLARLLSLKGDHASADDYLRLARALRASGQLAAAGRALDAGTARLGPVVTLELEAIDLLAQRRRWKEAIARLDAFAARLPRPEPWLVRKAALLAAAGRRTDARAAYQAALSAIARLPADTQRTAASTRLAADARAGLAQLRQGRAGVSSSKQLTSARR